jgi:hypothetical protein
MKALRAKAETQEQQIRQQLAESELRAQRTRELTARAPHQTQRRIGTIFKAGLNQKWKQRWCRLAGGKPATT